MTRFYGNKSAAASRTNFSAGNQLCIDYSAIFLRFRSALYQSGRREDLRLQSLYDPGSKKAVFSNPDHDWPTQLSYELVTSDNLLILVSGMQNGKMRIERFDLSRKK